MLSNCDGKKQAGEIGIRYQIRDDLLLPQIKKMFALNFREKHRGAASQIYFD
jgi:hypothetical protein